MTHRTQELVLGTYQLLQLVTNVRQFHVLGLESRDQAPLPDGCSFQLERSVGDPILQVIDRTLQFGGHVIERSTQIADLVEARGVHPLGQITGRDPFGRCRQILDRLNDPARHESDGSQTEERSEGCHVHRRDEGVGRRRERHREWLFGHDRQVMVTEFEVDGEMWVGSDGLRALEAAGQGTPTIAKGTLTTNDRTFTADIVLAGSSVPGHDTDAIVGNIIKRDGNFLTIRGATVIPRDVAIDRRVHFHDDIVVEVGPDTKVFKEGYRQSDLTIRALSIGQRVTVRGTQPTPTTDAPAFAR